MCARCSATGNFPELCVLPKCPSLDYLTNPCLCPLDHRLSEVSSHVSLRASQQGPALGFGPGCSASAPRRSSVCA